MNSGTPRPRDSTYPDNYTRIDSPLVSFHEDNSTSDDVLTSAAVLQPPRRAWRTPQSSTLEWEL